MTAGTIDERYAEAKLIPTSENADKELIRWHVQYWGGAPEAEGMTIRHSRGYTYRIETRRFSGIVRVVNPHDHREGVAGYR